MFKMTRRSKGNNLEEMDNSGESSSERKRQKCCWSNKESRISPITIEALNDDVLTEIFRYFFLTELIRLEQVSIRWKQVIQISYRRFKILHLYKPAKNKLSSQDLENILQRVGQYLTHFKLPLCPQMTNKNMLKVVNQYCKNLEHLQLTFFLGSKNDLNGLCKGIAENLKSFHIILFGDVFGCALSKILGKTRNLIHFSVQAFDFFEGLGLTKLPKTCQTLSLANCFNLKTVFLSSALQKLHNLKSLDISNCKFIGPSVLYHVSNQLTSLKLDNIEKFFSNNEFNRLDMLSFPNLRVLNVTDKSLTDEDVKNIVEKYPLLEDLTLTAGNLISSEGFRRLANLYHLIFLDVSRSNIKLDVLKYITLMSGKLKKIKCNNCVHLTQEGLIQLIDCCPELEYLNVGPFKKLESSFFTSALKSVENRSNLISLMIEISCDYHFKEVKEAQRLNLIKLKNQPLKCNGLKIKFDCKKFAVERDDFWYVNCNK